MHRLSKTPGAYNVMLICVATYMLQHTSYIAPENQRQTVARSMTQQQSKGSLGEAKTERKKIGAIIVVGNTAVPTYTILSKSPYQVGDIFDPKKSRVLLKGVYELGLISCVALDVTEDQPGIVTLIIRVTEKKPVNKIELKGASVLGASTLAKKLELASIPAADESDFMMLGEKIKKAYAEKDYHNITTSGEFVDKGDGSFDAVVTIDEGSPTHVQQVCIEGNTIVSARHLKSLLFTREDWLFGFLNRAGSFQPDAIEYDKNVIETYYQNHGYLAARVYDAVIEPIPDSCNVNVTFKIDEGDCYTIKEVKAAENKILSEADQLALISVRPGQLYSRELIRNSIETLKLVWGEYGYINAEVSPAIIPDTETKTVSISFHSTLGNKMRLNRIKLIGNTRTDDKVIRRQIALNEGELITSHRLELSKNRIQSLGYFDQKGGVNWNIVKIDDNLADLELLLQEVKTGSFFFQAGFGGIAADKSSPSESFRVSVGAQDSNWFGRGLQGSLSGSYSQQDRSVDVTIADPWLFDRPIYGSVHFFHRRSTYEEFKLTADSPSELTTAGFGKMGYNPISLSNVTLLGETGFESIKFRDVSGRDQEFSPLLRRKFQSGNVFSLGLGILQDLRNHPTHPTAGYFWNANTKVGVPLGSQSCEFGFAKWTIDTQWYAALIDEYNVVFRLRGFAGWIEQIHHYSIPYRELFHIGGPATVRGFTFGQIGPTVFGTSVGAKKAFTVTAELLFPITRDASIRGVTFYDGGAGWDTPDKHLIPEGLRDDHFEFRHAIGFGIRLTQPTPVSIDIGFKLDRKKRLGETLSEVHFTMTRDF